MRCLVLILILTAATPAQPAEDCYDRLVTATIVAQVPSPIPELDDGSVVMQWPWFVDLAIERAGGRVERLSVQTMQHTYSIRGLRGRWLLRENSMGGYNARWGAEAPHVRLCVRDTPPTPPHLGADDQEALEKLRREGEARYGLRS